MFPLKPLKTLFQRGKAWERYLAANINHIRPVVIESVEKMLACATSIFGSHEYHCENPKCTHTKYIHQTCKSRICNSCGVKATERWIAAQQHILPHCPWQHITFTMPDVLWQLFRHNRELLSLLFRCAAAILLNWAKKKGIDIGMFCALHTYGRKLNWNVHLHLSVTRGGLCKKTGQWKDIFFKAKEVEACWRYAVITLLRKNREKLNLSAAVFDDIGDEKPWKAFLNSQYNRYWKVHFAKKTNDIKHTVNYLGRYLKRPPISNSRLAHYSRGEDITFEYLDHRSGKKEKLTESVLELIGKLVDHIPDKHFKMLRYYGFLSNRNRGEMLPKVVEQLGQENTEAPMQPSYAAMLKRYVKVDPYECILCGCRMIFRRFQSGNSDIRVGIDGYCEDKM